MVKYRKDNNNNFYPSDRNTLLGVLSETGKKSNTPAISKLFDFLYLHILQDNDKSEREESFKESYRQKSLSELKEYCKDKLKVEFQNINDLTQEFIIDIILICFLTGRHGLCVQKRPLQNLVLSFQESKLFQLLKDTKTKFIVIHGNSNERQNYYVSQYIFNQLYNNSYHVSFESYQKSEISECYLSLNWLPSKYKIIKADFYSAIFNKR